MMRSMWIALLPMVRQTHRQLHDPNASTSATSAFQRAQRTDKATDRAISTFRNDQKAFHAAIRNTNIVVLGPSVEA